MTEGFSIDQFRLERYRAEADAARGASRSASTRLSEARYQLGQVKEELHRLERSPMGQPSGVIRRDENGRLHGRHESRHDSYLETARKRVEAAQAEVTRLSRAQSDGAAAREHATQLFAALERYTKERAR